MTGVSLAVRPAPAPLPRLILAVLDVEYAAVLNRCEACGAEAGVACMRSGGPVHMSDLRRCLPDIWRWATIYVHAERVYPGYTEAIAR